jgi:transmembrane sensor
LTVAATIPQHGGDGPTDVADVAIAWLVLTRSDAATAAHWKALTDWLDASPAHLAAFEAVESLSVEIDESAAEIRAALAGPSAEILTFPAAAPRPRIRRAIRRRLHPVPALAAALAALALAVGFGGWRLALGTAVLYQTAHGETRTITLADGTHVRLDAASTLNVRLGWFARRARLGEGEASFDVAHDPARPFDVAAGDQRVRVVGTEFNVSDYAGVVDVAVRRGVVEVYQAGGGRTPVATLTKGWSLEHTMGQPTSIRRPVKPDDAFAWADGRLICQGEPLARIAAYLDHRYAIPVHVAPAVADRRFSGVLELGEERDVVRRLAAYLALNVKTSSAEIDLD